MLSGLPSFHTESPPRSRLPHNPFLPLSRRLSTLFTTKRRQLPAREYFENPTTVEDVAYGHSSALTILTQKLEKCNTSHAGSPSENKTSGIDFVRDLNRTAKAWSTFFQRRFFEAYLGALKKVPSVVTCPQQSRFLEQEGDVGDVVLTNILAPVVNILKKLIAPGMADHLNIYVQHQASKTLHRQRENEHGQEVQESIVIHLDHAIVLVNSRWESENRKNKHDRLYLVIIEEKRAGYVKSAHWEEPQWIQSDNAEKHLNQVLLYAWKFDCPYVLLTDYISGVALHVLPQYDPEHPGRPDFDVASNPYPTLKEPQQWVQTPNPMNGGLRHGLCLLAVHAMHELRALNYDLFPTLEVQRDEKNQVIRTPKLTELLRAHTRRAEEVEDPVVEHPYGTRSRPRL